jgi:hypothetical protein
MPAADFEVLPLQPHGILAAASEHPDVVELDR